MFSDSNHSFMFARLPQNQHSKEQKGPGLDRGVSNHIWANR